MKCDHLFDIVDGLNGEYLQFLKDVCAIESPTYHKEGVDRVGEYFINKANKKGWLVEVQEQKVSGNAVCITMNPDATAAPVCFSGHMDTVHPIGLFGDEPVTWDDEKIYAPGVTDCKGGIVASFMAMDALERCGFKNRPVKLILQSDEENSSRTSDKTTVKFMGEKAKGCVCFLNTEYGSEKDITIERKGIYKYIFEVTGRAVHASACDEGTSAVCEAAHKIIRLEQYKNRDSITCNCGIINGGTAENTVPEKCTFTADFRFSTEAERKTIEKIVEEIANTSFIEGTSCVYTLASIRPQMEKSKESIELFGNIKRIFSENGLGEIRMVKGLEGSDASDMYQMGIPSLDSFGIIGGNIHKTSEYAYIDSLVLAAKRMAAIAYCI